MKKFLIIVSIFLTACTNLKPHFEQSDIDSGELSFIKTKKVGVFSGEYYPWIHSVYDADGNKIVQKAAYSNRINKLYLRPGQYLLVLLCDGGNSFAHPAISISLEPGKTYEASCEIGEVGKSIFGFDKPKSLEAKLIEVQPGEI